MDEQGQVMPSFDALVKKEYTLKEWLMYYLNIWQRNLMGSATDVMHDSSQDQASDTGDNKTDDLGRPMVDQKSGTFVKKTFAERLEERKENVLKCQRVITAIKALLSLSDDELVAKLDAGSDFMKLIAPPVEQGPALASFTVLPGQKIITDDTVTHEENTTVDLDPEDAQTKEWVAAGQIAPTRI